MPLWTPAKLAIDLWLDAADSSTLFTLNSGGVTPANGGTVGRWQDKSGNSRHITQATLASRPLYQTGSLNGLPAITFDGSNDVLTSSATGAVGKQNITLLVVFRMVTGGGSEDSPFAFGTPSSTATNRGPYRPSNGTVVWFGGWARDVASTFSWDIGGSYHIVGIGNTKLATPNNAVVFRNGDSQTLTTGGGNLSAITEGLAVGGLSVSGYFTNCSICEAVVLYDAMPLADRQKVEGYLAWKWGIASSLIAGHPYKNAAPSYGGSSPINGQSLIRPASAAQQQLLIQGAIS